MIGELQLQRAPSSGRNGIISLFFLLSTVLVIINTIWTNSGLSQETSWGKSRPNETTLLHNKIDTIVNYLAKTPDPTPVETLTDPRYEELLEKQKKMEQKLMKLEKLYLE